MLLDLEHLREDYRQAELSEEAVSKSPKQQFKKWFEEAMQSQVIEPNAMVLSTATKDGKPTARTVLLKSFDEGGFVFYTNYNSRKGKELAENPYASLLFLWLPLQRQIRIEGAVEKINPDESTKYFQSRPRGSQIGACASPQSQVIENRSFLEQEVSRIETEFKDQEKLPRPEHWGGYVLKPNLLEFWQGRSSRLHDRIQYRLEGEEWIIERLAP
jgi:pyridoxamine 5'-phosphate oxidase